MGNKTSKKETESTYGGLNCEECFEKLGELLLKLKDCGDDEGKINIFMKEIFEIIKYLDFTLKKELKEEETEEEETEEEETEEDKACLKKIQSFSEHIAKCRILLEDQEEFSKIPDTKRAELETHFEFFSKEITEMNEAQEELGKSMTDLSDTMSSTNDVVTRYLETQKIKDGTSTLSEAEQKTLIQEITVQRFQDIKKVLEKVKRDEELTDMETKLMDSVSQREIIKLKLEPKIEEIRGKVKKQEPISDVEKQLLIVYDEIR